ncbi:MAG TPA: chemotaxis protein CheW [Anaeromyxobacteraceae bacterium]|nr:chemotaxis protein CheW [Anaeromyxobacteraceae bacterium]
MDRLRHLEDEIQRAQAELAAMGGEALPGLHLVVEAGGRRALLAVTRVQEIVRLVAMEPLSGAPPEVRGTFVCRGLPVVAVDLAAYATGPRPEPALDAQVIVLAGAPAVGLVVDRIAGLVDGPRLFGGDADAATPEGWRGSRLLAGLCLHEGAVLPLLDPTPVASSVRECVA